MKYSGFGSDNDVDDETEADADADAEMDDVEIDPEVKEADEETVIEQVLIYLLCFIDIHVS